jgi:hypothetical protein
MKPTLNRTRNEKRFPLIDCNYRSAMFGGYRSRCAKSTSPSFRDISHQYFQNEARNDFVGEAILFAMLSVTAAVPLVSGAYAIIQLYRAFGAF